MNSKSAIQNVANVPNKFDKSGGNVTGNITLPNDTAITWNRNTDYAKIRFKNTADSDTDSYMLFETGDNGNEYFKFASTSGNTSTDWLTIKSDHLRFKGNAVYHTANKPTPADIGALASGATAVAANKLATARKINGTNFDGTGDITTTNWGTARNITIGNSQKSVNGSVDMSWSLADIGAAAASHSHNYLPLSGGTLTGIVTAPVLNITDNNGYRHNSLGAGDNHVIGVASGIVYLGNPQAKTQIEANSNPTVLVNGSKHTMYHTGNKPTPSEIGAIPNSKITVSQTAPSNPSTGDLWISW